GTHYVYIMGTLCKSFLRESLQRLFDGLTDAAELIHPPGILRLWSYRLTIVRQAVLIMSPQLHARLVLQQCRKPLGHPELDQSLRQLKYIHKRMRHQTSK